MVDMPRGKKRKKAKPFVTVEGLEELAEQYRALADVERLRADRLVMELDTMQRSFGINPEQLPPTVQELGPVKSEHRISTDRLRKVMKPIADGASDEELIELRSHLYGLADVLTDAIAKAPTDTDLWEDGVRRPAKSELLDLELATQYAEELLEEEEGE